MEDNRGLIPTHPQGEAQSGEADLGEAVDTFGGKVFVRWDADVAVTALAPVTYCLEFLKANGLWRQWVEDCPLQYPKGNAPPKQDILGTLLLSVPAGHKRYSHVTTMHGDSVLPGLIRDGARTEWGRGARLSKTKLLDVPAPLSRALEFGSFAFSLPHRAQQSGDRGRVSAALRQG
jgi:hypothetical protein